jgi:hypothetical protein
VPSHPCSSSDLSPPSPLPDIIAAVPVPTAHNLSLCQQKNEREKEEIEEEIEKRKKGMKGEHGMN